ncbi:DUF4073 domain-containing protein [Cohnella sp. 56]|uniref:DUF4073 domain-containing protein n=1 Tax=Cohnella sp. 56 TaxID=3113722 RepID=UPI0030E952E9
MKRKSFLIIRLFVALLLLQPLLGGLGTWERAHADRGTPLDQINMALEDGGDTDAMLEALANPDANLKLPTDFDKWKDTDKTLAAEAVIEVLDMFQASRYESMAEVQLMLDLINVTFTDYNDLSLTALRGKVDRLFELFKTIPAVFAGSDSEQQADQLAQMLSGYDSMTEADKENFIYLTKLWKLPEAIEMTPFNLVKAVLGYAYAPSINRASSPEDMMEVLGLMASVPDLRKDFIHDYPNVPMEEWPLDFSRLADPDVTDEDRAALVQWMLDKRPEGGYETVAKIQSTFDSFFSSSALHAVNAALAKEDPKYMLAALTDPALGLNLPADFDKWSKQNQKYWADAVRTFNNTKGFAYDNFKQVQFVADLAARPFALLNDRSLKNVGTTINEVFDQIADIDTVFPDLEESKMFAQMADAYIALTPVDKHIFAYRLYLQLAVAGDVESTELNPASLLSAILLGAAYYPAVNGVSAPEQMKAVLTSLQDVQAMVKQLKEQYPEITIENWNLDLSKMNDPKRYDALAQWMLDKRPEGGYADLAAVQSAFDRFFVPAAPQVTADDNADKLVGADATMEFSIDGGATWTSYDPERTPSFVSNVTVLVRVKASGAAPAGETTSVTFTQPAVYVPSQPGPSSETLYVDVQGSNGGGLARTPVIRTTDASGKVTDSVTLSADTAKEAVAKAKEQSGSTIRIVLPEAGDRVSEVSVNIPQAALSQINDAQMNLEITTGDAVVTIPTASITGFGQDLYFRLVPVKSDDQRGQIEARAKQEKAVQAYVLNQAVKLYGRPVQIETNLQSKKVTIALPVKEGLPSDATERNRLLEHLGVYVEHSDGTKDLVKGTVVQVGGTPAVQFDIQKFSTFSLVYMDGLNNNPPATQTHTPYINGFGAQFRPDASVTRAQMAAMLARNLSGINVPANANPGSDVGVDHWARADILKAQTAGIMNGLGGGKFGPEAAVTRAQMAAIVARWLQRNAAQPLTGSADYRDVAAGHWAASSISIVTAAGIMTGYNGDTFKPDQPLTRAEAVKVLNRLFGRGPLNGATEVTFSDVPATHWAYSDIEEAASEHAYTIDAQGAEQIAVNP